MFLIMHIIRLRINILSPCQQIAYDIVIATGVSDYLRNKIFSQAKYKQTMELRQKQTKIIKKNRRDVWYICTDKQPVTSVNNCCVELLKSSAFSHLLNFLRLQFSFGNIILLHPLNTLCKVCLKYMFPSDKV